MILEGYLSKQSHPLPSETKLLYECLHPNLPHHHEYSTVNIWLICAVACRTLTDEGLTRYG